MNIVKRRRDAVCLQMALLHDITHESPHKGIFGESPVIDAIHVDKEMRGQELAPTQLENVRCKTLQDPGLANARRSNERDTSCFHDGLIDLAHQGFSAIKVCWI